MGTQRHRKEYNRTVQLSAGDSCGKLVVEEDFMCAVAQWYLECDCFISGVKILCQEKDSDNIVRE
jgi:hypothetical protein